jgi:hypothetical protein
MAAAPSLMEGVRSPDRVVWKVSDSFTALPDSSGTEEWSDAPGDSGAPRWTPVIEPPRELADWDLGPTIVDVEGRPTPAAWDPRTQVKLPDFVSLSLRESIQRASRLGIELSFSGVGRIVSQDPEPGEIVERGATIRVNNP